MLDVARPVDVADGPDMSSTQPRESRDSSIRRGHTISGVTAEARDVFEHVLQRSQSDLTSSAGRRRHRRPVTRRHLAAIDEANTTAYITQRADESADNWTTDVTRDSIETRLSGLDETDGFLSRSSVQSGDGLLRDSRDSVDVFQSRHSTGTRPSSTDELGDGDFGPVQSNTYSQQSSRDSEDLLASSGGVTGQQRAEASSLASMSAELEDDISDADDERKRRKMSEKKKKSVFQRVRERLRATFSRDEDRNRASRKASKYMHTNGEVRKENWLRASFRRRRKKHQSIREQGSESGSASTSKRLFFSTNPDPRSRNVNGRQSARFDQHRSKESLMSSIRRRISNRRSQSQASSASSKLSQSADEATIHPPSESQRQILSRYVTGSAGDQTSAVTSSVDSRQGHHSIRATFHLDIAQRARPATAASDSAVVADSDRMASSDLEERVRDWDFIDGESQELPSLSHATTRTFSDKSPAEKEELYERIASRLISIGDSYAITVPPDDQSDECAAASQAVGTSTLEVGIDWSMVGSQLMHTATQGYSSFQSAISEAIRGEPSLQQLACVFQLSTVAIEHAGVSTQLAVSIKNMTMRYFEEYLAPWLVEQGGWESIVESTDDELD